jgi:uncharacterized protein YbbK (DUF523 family)
MDQVEKIKVGISWCLLGENVRYDGGNKLDPFLVESLGKIVEFIPLCPEFEAGFGVPREPVRLVRVHNEITPRMITTETRCDVTEPILTWMETRMKHLQEQGLRGFIFKSKSPSCALKDLNIYDSDHQLRGQGMGLFARTFLRRFPNIPVADERDLRIEEKRNIFVKQITIDPFNS